MRGLSGVSQWVVWTNKSPPTASKHTRPQTSNRGWDISGDQKILCVSRLGSRCEAAVVARPSLVGSPSSPPEECCFCPWRLRGTANPYVSPHPLPPPINPQAYPNGQPFVRKTMETRGETNTRCVLVTRTPDVSLFLRH